MTVGAPPSRRAVGVTSIVAVAALGAFGIWRFTKTPEVAAPAPSAIASASPASASVPLVSAEIDEGRTASFGALPTLVSAPTNLLSDEKIALGRMLYYDPRLSKNHDISCNSCHALDTYGVDGKKLSSGHAADGLIKAWPYVRDRGRYELTQKNEDYMVFRVPSLRNVEKTGPYLHDGSVTSLEEVVKMMARHRIGKEIADEQATLIVVWLKSLTGELPTEYIKKPELFANAKSTPPPEL